MNHMSAIGAAVPLPDTVTKKTKLQIQPKTVSKYLKHLA